MKKSYLTITIIAIVVLICLAIIIILLSPLHLTIKGVEEGRYYDASGNALGTCKIETRDCPLCDMPSYTSYFYTMEGKLIGECKGKDNIGCYGNTEKSPHPCSSELLEETCNDRPYYATKLKYTCMTNNST